MSDQKVFAKGFLPRADTMPKEKTHARGKLVYNILKVLCYFSPAKQYAAMQELRETNNVLYDLVRTCWDRLTPEDVKFFKGPRPHFHADGKLAIYHPQLDNPLIKVVLAVVEPQDADRFGQRQPKLVVPRSVGGIL